MFISAGTTVSYSDDYTEDSVTDIKLAATLSVDIVSLLFVAYDTGVDAEMTYSITHLA
jgi:hypothetical protein